MKSKKLQQAVLDSENIFNQYQESMNQVSTDIKSLNTYLRSKNIALRFEKHYPKANIWLAWGIRGVKGEIQRHTSSNKCEVLINGEDNIFISLVESSLNDRILAMRVLPQFVRDLADFIQLADKT